MKKISRVLPVVALALGLTASAFTTSEKLQDQGWFPRLSDGSYSEQPMEFNQIPCEAVPNEICASLFAIDPVTGERTGEPLDHKSGVYLGQ